MKRIFKFFIIFMVLITLSACSEKKELTKDFVLKKASSNGFLITDSTNQIEDENISYIASLNNDKYQIEYYIFVNEKTAKEAYKNNKESFDNSSKTKGKEKNNDNYQKYTQKLSDTYNLLLRKDNMLIYSSVNIEYKNDLNKVISDLGY